MNNPTSCPALAAPGTVTEATTRQVTPSSVEHSPVYEPVPVRLNRNSTGALTPVIRRYVSNVPSPVLS